MLKEGVALHSHSRVSLTDRFTNHLKSNWPGIVGAKVLLAVSGGADSTAMFHLMLEASNVLDFEMAVAHFDHALRGEESRRDALFVQELAKSKGLPFYLGMADVRLHAQRESLTLQEAARELRYKFLFETASKIEAPFIATAHTADDQAEEVLMRLVRGTSMAGLSGIPANRDSIFRPLLPFTKEELLGFLVQRDLAFVQDSSNEKECYLRNRVRKKLIPAIKKGFNPSIVDTLCRTAELLNEEHQFLDRLALKLLERALVERKASELAVLLVEEFKRSDPVLRRRAFVHLLSDWPQTKRLILREHLEALNRLVDGDAPVSSSEVVLPAGLIARRSYDMLVLARYTYWDQFENECYKIEVHGPGQFDLPATLGRVTISLCERPASFEHTSIPKVLWVSAQKARFPWMLRTRQRGDTFWPLNRSGHRRLKKFLIGKKVSKYARKSLPLIAEGDEIVAIAGLEVNHLYKVGKNEKKVLRIEWLDCPMWVYGNFLR